MYTTYWCTQNKKKQKQTNKTKAKTKQLVLDKTRLVKLTLSTRYMPHVVYFFIGVLHRDFLFLLFVLVFFYIYNFHYIIIFNNPRNTLGLLTLVEKPGKKKTKKKQLLKPTQHACDGICIMFKRGFGKPVETLSRCTLVIAWCTRTLGQNTGD